MSIFKVPLTTVKSVFPHPNADRLSIAVVYGFNIVVGKDQYEAGDLCIFVSPDSLLPLDLEVKLFGPESKIKLNKGRVKQIKIRGAYSQGMLIKPNMVLDVNYQLETDLAEVLKITKYEPGPAAFQGSNTSVRKRDKPKENPFFHKYGGIDNFKWYPELFAEGEEVSVTEKIHGSNIRFGLVPYVANNLWRKLLKKLGLAPQYEWVYGSNNVQLQQRCGYKGFYGEDVYGKVLAKYNAKDKVKPGEIWYGELYGDGIQKGYTYGCTNGEHKLVVFDMKLQDGVDAKYIDAEYFFNLAHARGFETCPEVYRGPYNANIKLFTQGDSVLVPAQKVREGVVLKTLKETNSIIGRKLLKLISEKYLESDQTDFH